MSVTVLAGAFQALAPAASAACPNEAFRTGPSAGLPDCRAYEMVTPRAESNGRLFNDLSPFRRTYDMFPIEPLSPAADSYVFETYASPFQAPPGANGELEGDAWESQREVGGWRVFRHVTPTGAELPVPNPGGISADHEFNFVFAMKVIDEFNPNGSLAAEGDADYIGDKSGRFELTGIGSLGGEQVTEKLAQGRYISPGGKHVIFSTGRAEGGSGWCSKLKFTCPVAKLAPEAPPAGTGAIYDREINGPIHVVSLLPPNITPGAGQEAIYQGTSADASSVAFKIGTTLYIRVNNGEEGATTELVTTSASTFGGISSEGKYLYYATGASIEHPNGGNIHRFDTETEADQQVNSSGDADMVNVSADGTHLYFISPSQLDGAKGAAGGPNLYVWSGGVPEYIATVDPADAEGSRNLTKWADSVGPAALGPGLDPSRSTPGGGVLVFESRAQLTPPYDNAGKTEIYRFDEEAATPSEALTCVSCNPAGTAATVGARLELVENPGGMEPTTVIHNVTDDGEMVFFETAEPLVEPDEDGVVDVYEWQASGPEGDAALYLISSGKSINYPHLSSFTSGGSPNLLMGVSPDGSDVVFRSFDSLTPGAAVGGAMAIYDARVNGGFPEPSIPVPCLEEACRPPASPPPALAAPATSAFQGPGNVRPAKKKHKKHRHCRRRRSGGRKHCGKRHRKGSGRAGASTSTAAGASGGSALATPTVLDATTIPHATANQPQAKSAEAEFGIEAVFGKLSSTQAARHPDLTPGFSFNHIEKPTSPRPENVAVELPRGFYANPSLVPTCKTGELIGGSCPIDSQVGVARVRLFNHGGGFATVPLFNLAAAHPEAEVARLGFMAVTFPVFIDASVRTAVDYGITATTRGINAVEPIEAFEATVWGNPADPSHDEQRMTIQESNECNGTACKAPGGKRSTEELGPVAFTTNPAACGQGEIRVSATSYQLPGQVFSKSALIEPGPITDCQGLPFAPSLEARPTTDVAGAPTGLKTSLKLPQSSDPSVPSTAPVREARVTLPPGMVVNPAAADGLDACSDEQIHFHQEVDAQCPDAAKIGALKAISPALSKPLEGAVYQRSPEPGHLLRLWLVIDQLGLHVKIPGEAVADPASGQLTAVFSDLPQLPLEEVDLELWGGPRAPLRNPETCGVYETTSVLSPWSDDPPARPSDQFVIDRSPAGACTAGDPSQPANPADVAKLPFAPSYEAGTTTPIAGQFSPLIVRIARHDGEQQITSQHGQLPPGLLAKLAGSEYCPEAALAAAAAKSGSEELASPSCPPASHIGSLFAALGAGPSPFWRKGEIYLAGPYQGAPLSLAFIAPAVAGPFDLGDVVVRDPLYVDPETGRAHDAAQLPLILQGIPLQIREVRVAIDRPDFTLNPTNCAPMAFSAEIGGAGASLLDPADDVTRSLSNPFQVGECGRLGFKPKLGLILKGGTKRAEYPALRSTLKTRRGDANFKKISVALPHSEFVAQEHFETICTRVQFAAHHCPKGSVYGHVKAWSPLLAKPLAGPVYLRSSSHPLPDLVLDLRGQIEIVAVARVDSHHGGIRATFEAVPDAPVSKVRLTMQGGEKGLFINSTDICKGHRRLEIKLWAQNGRRASLHPQLVNPACGKKQQRRGSR